MNGGEGIFSSEFKSSFKESISYARRRQWLTTNPDEDLLDGASKAKVLNIAQSEGPRRRSNGGASINRHQNFGRFLKSLDLFVEFGSLRKGDREISVYAFEGVHDALYRTKKSKQKSSRKCK